MIIIIPAIVIITTTRGDIEFWPYHHQRHHHHQNDHQALPVRKIQVRQPTSCFFHPLLLRSEQMGIRILIRMTTIYILWWSVCGFVCHEKLPLSQVVYVCLSVCNVLKVTPQFECLVWWVDDIYIMTKCLFVCDLLSSLYALPFYPHFLERSVCLFVSHILSSLSALPSRRGLRCVPQSIW